MRDGSFAAHRVAPMEPANGGYRKFLHLRCRDLTDRSPPSATVLGFAMRLPYGVGMGCKRILLRGVTDRFCVGALSLVR